MNSMIKPVVPISLPELHFAWGETILLSLFIVLSVGFTALLIGFYAARKFGSSRWKTAWSFAGIAVAISVVLLCFFGCAVGAIKGILLSLVLAYCSYSDIKQREVDDALHLMIVLTAFVGAQVQSIPLMLLSAILISIPSLLVCVLCQGKTIGGADIKLIAACAFLLGITRGLFGFTVGLTLGIIVNFIIQIKKKKTETEGFPLVPYLAAGFMAAYFI